MDEALAQWNDKARVSASPEGIKAHLGLALRLASGKLKAGGSKSLLFVPLECSFYLVKKQGGVEEKTMVAAADSSNMERMIQVAASAFAEA
jgi:hypothetical protein